MAFGRLFLFFFFFFLLLTSALVRFSFLYGHKVSDDGHVTREDIFHQDKLFLPIFWMRVEEDILSFLISEVCLSYTQNNIYVIH